MGKEDRAKFAVEIERLMRCGLEDTDVAQQVSVPKHVLIGIIRDLMERATNG